MKNLFQNKFMIVLIVISVLLVGTTSFISALGYTSYVRNAIGIVLTPVQQGANFIFDSIENIFSSKEDYKKLKKENEELKKQLADNKACLSEAELAIAQYKELKNYLGIKEEHTNITFENAVVTGRQSGTHTTIYTVNKGTYHGINPGMPVIDNYGVVGCVSEAGLTWCKVTSVIEPDISLGIIVERTGDSGICNGSFTAAKNGLCVVSYLPADTDIKEGDIIITSDESSVYPKGLLVGTIKSIEPDPVSREIKAYVEPASNLTEVEKVMIITGFESVYE